MSANTDFTLEKASQILDILISLKDQRNLRLVFKNDGSLSTEPIGWYRTLAKVGNYFLPYFIISDRDINKLTPLIWNTTYTLETNTSSLNHSELKQLISKIQKAVEILKRFKIQYEHSETHKTTIQKSMEYLETCQISLVNTLAVVISEEMIQSRSSHN